MELSTLELNPSFQIENQDFQEEFDEEENDSSESNKVDCKADPITNGKDHDDKFYTGSVGLNYKCVPKSEIVDEIVNTNDPINSLIDDGYLDYDCNMYNEEDPFPEYTTEARVDYGFDTERIEIPEDRTEEGNVNENSSITSKHQTSTEQAIFRTGHESYTEGSSLATGETQDYCLDNGTIELTQCDEAENEANMETEKQITDPYWHVFRLSKIEQQLEYTTCDEDLDALLKLNFGLIQRIKESKIAIQVQLARVKERMMILEGKMTHPESHRKRKYEKPVQTQHFKKGYFVDREHGWTPTTEIADKGLKKLKCLEPFDDSEPPKIWTKKEDNALRTGITQCQAKPIIKKIRKDLSAGSELIDSEKKKEKVEEIKTKIRKIKQTCDRDLIGSRNDKHDWDGIANVSLEEKRTAMQCKLRWKNHVHDDLRNNAWTKEELIKLDEQVRRFGKQGCWAKIAEQIPGRSAIHCFQRMRKIEMDEDKGRGWTDIEDRQLLLAVQRNSDDGSNGGVNWNSVAHGVPGRTPTQCAHRYKKSADPSIRKGAWERREDIALLKAIREVGTEWSKIRDSNVCPGRTDMQIRDRYYNCLSDKHMKGPWTKEEDELLMINYDRYGPQWTMVSNGVGTRTDGQCLKRIELLENYKRRKQPVKYQKSTAESKLTRIVNLRQEIETEYANEEKTKALLKDNDLG